MESNEAYELFRNRALSYGFKYLPLYIGQRKEITQFDKTNLRAITKALYQTLQKYPILLELKLLKTLGSYLPNNPGDIRLRDQFKIIRRTQPNGIKNETLEEILRDVHNVKESIEISIVSRKDKKLKVNKVSGSYVAYFLDRRKRDSLARKIYEPRKPVTTIVFERAE